MLLENLKCKMCVSLKFCIFTIYLPSLSSLSHLQFGCSCCTCEAILEHRQNCINPRGFIVHSARVDVIDIFGKWTISWIVHARTRMLRCCRRMSMTSLPDARQHRSVFVEFSSPQKNFHRNWRSRERQSFFPSSARSISHNYKDIFFLLTLSLCVVIFQGSR